MAGTKTIYKFVAAAILLFSFTYSSAQNMKQKNDSVFVLLKNAISTKNTDAIYDLLGKDYQKATSKTDFEGFFEKQIFPLGQLNETVFLSFKDGLSNYKLAFEKFTLQLSMTPDKENKIAGLLFKPYQPEKPNKPAPVATSNPIQTDLEKKIDAVVRTYIQKPNTVGLSIGVFYADKNSIYHYGETAKGNGKLPDSNSILEIGSISKTFTATLLAYFADQGKIKLSDPITKFLPDSVAKNTLLKEVSIRMLSNHTSGLAPLPDNFETENYNPLNPYQNYTRKLLFSYLKTCKLKSKPGEVYAYSNMAAGLLGVILERISGKSYEDLVKLIICKPLKMKNTAEHLSPQEKTHFVKVYNAEGNETPAWDFDALQACGSLRSTVNDLLKYAEANMKTTENQLSKAFQLTHQLTFGKNQKVGLGWHILKIADADYLFHNGGTGGSRSFLAFNAEKKIAVVVLSNASDSVDDVGGNLIKLLQ